ncbi:hypothetical protein T4B_12634 [Trichinella pseudospiralis]|uniref:Uncharacterized protein n=1 Tax=Trichinella pseudospiralis TaxID=6337 RepID=A0A0V1IHW4_TRIPS|nr:hypothetical protein T4B_12634 [Trichinella pseudospiralis]
MSSIQRERGHKITKDALNISTSMKCEQWLGQSREIIWCIGERNAVCVAIRRKILDGKKSEGGPVYLGATWRVARNDFSASSS